MYFSLLRIVQPYAELPISLGRAPSEVLPARVASLLFCVLASMKSLGENMGEY